MLNKDQSSFYKICSLAICINIKAFSSINRKHFWSIWKIILLLTENDSALKVAKQVTFRGLVAHKPVAYKNKKV